jgi:O-antigen ligase
MQPKRSLSVSGLLGELGEFDLALVLFLAAMLLVRVLSDDRSSPDSRHSGSLNLSGAIAVLFVLVAAYALFRRRRGLAPTALAALWLCVWTAVALGTRGASTETLREGVREGSVLAIAVIVCNARGAVSVPIAARLVQLAGVIPAVLAVYQLASHTGMDVGGNIRANGTFAHPNSASMFFAIAAAASMWLYLDSGRRRLDALLVPLFAAALVATASIDGLVSLTAMLIAIGVSRPGSLMVKLGPCLVAGLVVVAFLASPLGGHRIARASSTSLAEANGTSLSWRFHKWKLLIPEWERSPVVGRGLGITTTEAGMPGNQFAGEPPHNEYVRYLVETGVVGLLALLGGLALLTGRLIGLRRDGPSALDASVLAIAVAIGCLVNALADNTFLDSPTAYAATLVVIAALSLPKVRPRRASAA